MKPCDWCADDTCSYYWIVNLYGEKYYSICNCCYGHLTRIEGGLSTKESIIKKYLNAIEGVDE